eukprot:352861-Chlamydomonas_euryale.AAC.4
MARPAGASQAAQTAYPCSLGRRRVCGPTSGVSAQSDTGRSARGRHVLVGTGEARYRVDIGEARYHVGTGEARTRRGAGAGEERYCAGTRQARGRHDIVSAMPMDTVAVMPWHGIKSTSSRSSLLLAGHGPGSGAWHALALHS